MSDSPNHSEQPTEPIVNTERTAAEAPQDRDLMWTPTPTTTAPPAAKRSNNLGIVAALAVGALVGGVSGAGVAVWAVNSSQDDRVVGTSVPSTITVNDGADATLITAVAASAGPSVVTVSVAGRDAAGTGSGVILSDDGYVLTNTHVVTLDGEAADTDIIVQTYDGHLYTGTLVGTDPITDLAVIKIEGGDNFQPADFADSDKLNVGDTTIAIGAPLGLSNTVTNGIVSALNRSITVKSSAAPENDGDVPDDENNGNGPFDFWEFGQSPQSQDPSQQSTIFLPVIQTDAAINPGNSGGALLDADGKVIGINVAIASTGSSGASQSGSIGVGFAIPSNVAKRIADDLIKNGTARHGLLGASVMDVTSDADIRNKTMVGASIKEITQGGAADAAGLRKGDIVTSFNGIPITGSTDLTAQVRAVEPGTEVPLTYVRGGSEHSVTVTLGELE